MPATEVAIDFLAILLSELEARGVTYRAVAIFEGIDNVVTKQFEAKVPLTVGDVPYRNPAGVGIP